MAASARQLNTLLAVLAKQADSIEDVVSKPPREITLVTDEHKAQYDFITDPAKLKVVHATRRAGKSYGAGLYLVDTALKNPGVSVLYTALTRQTAKRIMWKDVFKKIDREHDLGMKFNETELSITLTNGSVIYLLGMDASEAEMEKALGQKYMLAIIDEAASYTIDLNSLVYGVLKPAMADYRGTICLIGTPSDIKRGLYYSLTAGQNPGDAGTWTTNGWSGHRWSATDNPNIREQWLAEIEDLKKANPRIVETPLFKRNYLGQWTSDDSNKVYKYNPDRNDFDGKLPEYDAGSWHHVLAVDLGWNDPTSFTVLAYHDHDKKTYIRESWKKPKLTFTQVASHTQELDDTYHFESMVIDGANKQAVETMKRDYQVPFVAIDKQGKADFIELMNDAFIRGDIVLDPTQCAALVEEYDGLIWDAVPSIGENGETVWINKKADKRQEHPGCENHCADGGLYGYRKVYAYLAEAYKPKPAVGTAAWMQGQMDEWEERDVEDVRRARLEQEEDEAWT